MEHYNTDFTEELITDTGGVMENKEAEAFNDAHLSLYSVWATVLAENLGLPQDVKNEDGEKYIMEAHELVLPFHTLLELLKLPPNTLKSTMPAYISYQWKSDPIKLIEFIKEMPPTATMSEIIDQLHTDIQSGSLQAFLDSPTPAHGVLPTPRLMDLLKFPRGAKPVILPNFILINREANPKELISRLEAMSTEEDILEKIIKEHTREVNSGTHKEQETTMASQHETSAEYVQERDQSANTAQDKTESGNPAKAEKVQQKNSPPHDKTIKAPHQKRVPDSKEQKPEEQAEAKKLSNMRDLNILKKNKMLEIQENQREQAKAALQEEADRQTKKETNKKKAVKKAKAKEKQGNAEPQANTNTKLESLNNNLESMFMEAGLNIQDWIIYKAKPNGACASNCIAIALLHDEGQGQSLRITINKFIVKYWEYQKQFMAFPHTQMVGKQAITFTEEQYKEFLSKDERSGTLWIEHTDLQAMANYFQVAIHILTTDVRNVKGTKPRWTHIEPDERMKIHTPIKTELPDVWMLHVDNTHFDLIIKKDDRLVTEGDLHQPITPGKQNENNAKIELKVKDPKPHMQTHTKVQQSTQKEQNIKSQKHHQKHKKDDSVKEIIRQKAPLSEPHTAKNPAKPKNLSKKKDRKKNELIPKTHETDPAYEGKLNTVKKGNESGRRDADAKLEHARILKEKGTKHFKNSRYETASTTYQQVIEYLEHETFLKKEPEAERKILLQAGRLNLALCYLKLGNWIQARVVCDKAIEESGTVAKAWFRRGEAQLALNNFKAAKADFEKTLILEPENKAARNKVIICQQKMKIQKEKEEITHPNMLDKPAETEVTKEGAEKGKKNNVKTEPKKKQIGNCSPFSSYRTSPTSNDQILPKQEFLKLLKLPQDYPPTCLPLSLLREWETDPKGLKKRLMEASEAAPKNDAKQKPEKVVIKTNETEKEETKPGESSDAPETPQNKNNNKNKEGQESKEGDASTAPVTEHQTKILEKASFHEHGTNGDEGDITKEDVEKSKESVIDGKPENDINTDSQQKQVNTKSAEPNKSHKEMVAEDRVQKTNVMETTTIESIKTDSGNVCTTGTVNEVEQSVTKESAMVEEDNSTEKTSAQPKGKENGDTITENVNVASGPNPLTGEPDEHLVAEEAIATVSNSKMSKEEPNTTRKGGKSSIADKDVVKEPSPSINHKQVKDLQSKTEKLITNEDSESHTIDKHAKISTSTKRKAQNNLKQEAGWSAGQSVMKTKDEHDEREKSNEVISQVKRTHHKDTKTPKELITAKGSHKRVVNLEIVEKIKPTRRRSAPYNTETSDHTVPEGWRSQMDKKSKTTVIEDPDKNHSLYGKTELHNNSDTTADSQEISQKENEFKEELEQNNDNHPTRRQEEVPSNKTQIMIKGSNLSESPSSANKNIQTFSKEVDETVDDIPGGHKDKNIQEGWKQKRDKNTNGTTFFPSPKNQQFHNRKNSPQYTLQQEGWKKSQDIPHGWMIRNTKHKTEFLQSKKEELNISQIKVKVSTSNNTQCKLGSLHKNKKPTKEQNSPKNVSQSHQGRNQERIENRNLPSGWKKEISYNELSTRNKPSIGKSIQNRCQEIQPAKELKDTISQIKRKGKKDRQYIPNGWMTRGNKIKQWLSVIILITGLPMINLKPIPDTQSTEQEEFLFQVNDCAGMTGKNLNIQTYNGGTPPSCKNAKIYEEPVQTPVQIMVLPDRHPVQFVQCKVHIKAISGMCDLIRVINGRNVNLLSKIVYDDYYAPHPEDCFNANRTGSITFQLPIIGSYPGEEVTQKLVSNRMSGTVYPYGEPGKVNCLGANWVDPNDNIQRQATLEIQYTIQIENVWGYYHLQSGKVMVNGVSFPISSANTFKREKPKPKPVQIQYKDSVLLDQDRQALFVQVGEHASPEVKKILDRAGYSSDDKLQAIANDPEKTEVLHQALAKYFYDPNSTAYQFASSGALYKRDTEQKLTYFHDWEEGVIVTHTETVPKDKCDSLREITRIEKANYHKTNNNQFKDTITFKDQSSSNTGFALSINKTQLLCGIQVYQLPKESLYLFKPNNTGDFIRIPSAEGRFLDKSISQDTKVITLLNSANMAVVSLAETIDEQVCELQRGITQNKLEIINAGAQHIQDQEGTFIQTKVSGEAIYTITCRKVTAKVRSMENVCCNELPIWLPGEDNTFNVKAFMLPHSKRTTKFCKARMCHPQFPAYYNVSNDVQEKYYKVERGIPELTNYYPPPFELYQINPINIPQAFALDTLSEDQREEMSTVILEDGGREAVNSIVAVGTLHTYQQYIPDILKKANVVPTEMLEAAQELFDISPMAGIFNLLPKEAKMIVSILSLLFVAWAGVHVIFLIGAFMRKYKIIGKRESFQSTFAPTVQIHKLTERSVEHGAEISNLQETMESMQRNQNKTQAEILNRLRALEDQKLTEKEDSNESE